MSGLTYLSFILKLESSAPSSLLLSLSSTGYVLLLQSSIQALLSLIPSEEIDPLLFRRYQIAKVPAVVYATDVNVMDMQMSEGLESNTEVSNYYVLYGDASLEYVLDTIHKETKSESIEGLLAVLKKGFY